MKTTKKTIEVATNPSGNLTFIRTARIAADGAVILCGKRNIHLSWRVV